MANAITDLRQQRAELDDLDFDPPVEGKFANRYTSLAKCRTCRCYVEVPLIWADGPGDDAIGHKEHHDRIWRALNGQLPRL